MRAFLRFNRGLLAMPGHLQAWVLVLIGANLVAPFFFLEHPEARIVLATGLLGMGLMTALTGRFGFSRIVGLGHVAWLPLLGYLWLRLPDVPAGDAFGLWLRAVIAVDAISLAFDGADVVRYLRGDRAETVPDLQPPLHAVPSRT